MSIGLSTAQHPEYGAGIEGKQKKGTVRSSGNAPDEVQSHAATGTNAADRLVPFLNAYWLRPENAFWMAIRSHVLAGANLEPPTADVCCGDGVFSFLHCGGMLHEDFDVFLGADLGSRPSAGGDMFDHIGAAYTPVAVQAPRYRFDTGVDHKPTLLEKARRLDFYNALVAHDANQRLPFSDGCFRSVYCNSAYWIREIDTFLRELARITAPGGRIVLHVKLDSFHDYSLNRYRAALGERFLTRINGGRLDNWLTLANEATWLARFARAGLEIVERSPFITATHVHIWEIGLRPIAPILARMAQALDPATRHAIKREWVELFRDLTEPLCNTSLNLVAGHKPAEVQYILCPRDR